jgi:proteasome lid subunit RPN8/RPN11
MRVHRVKPLPVRPAIGHLVVAESVIHRTREMLQEAGQQEPPHEGLVWWLGRQVGSDSLIVSAHRPPVSSGPDFVFTDEAAAGTAGRLARRNRLGVVAQIHSHPGSDTRHSDGDDDLILMPFEGMFSLVIADYGRGGLTLAEGAGLHQYQDGQWILVDPESDQLLVVPEESMA